MTLGCVHVQITALGNPKLLERVAAGLMAIRNLFSQFDLDMNNVITREEFIKVSQQPPVWLLPLDSISGRSHSCIDQFLSMISCCGTLLLVVGLKGTCNDAVQVYNEMFTDATEERTERMFHYLDPDNTGYVDYLGWSQSIKLQVSPLAQLLDPV